MKKKIYIFNGLSRAAAYGIGTYIDQLILCLKKSKIDFNIVYLHAKCDNVNVVNKDGYGQINIPKVEYKSQIKSSLYYAKSVAYLLRDIIVDDENIQYIFHLNFMTNESLVKDLRQLFKCKIILVAHYTNWSFEFLGNEKRFYKLMQKKYSEIKFDNERNIYKSAKEDIRMIKKSDRFVCVAEHTYNSFCKISDITNVQNLIINNGIKDEYKRVNKEMKNIIRKKYFLNHDTPVILFAGRLDEVKGVSYIIKAFKKTHELYPNARLFIAGEGSFSGLLNDSKNHWTNISFTGKLDKKQLFEFYNISNIGIISSLHEEFGLVAIEMMMHELPIIASDTGGLSEIIEENISGLKIQIETKQEKRFINTAKLSQKINCLLENPQKAKELGVNARKRFLDKYELSVFEKKMINLYHTI